MPEPDRQPRARSGGSAKKGGFFKRKTFGISNSVLSIGGVVLGIAAYEYEKKKNAAAATTAAATSTGATTGAPTITPGGYVPQPGKQSRGGHGGGGNSGLPGAVAAAVVAALDQNPPPQNNGPGSSSNSAAQYGPNGTSWYGGPISPNAPYGTDINGVPLAGPNYSGPSGPAPGGGGGSQNAGASGNSAAASGKAAGQSSKPSWASTSFASKGVTYYGLGNASDVSKAQAAGYTITTAKAAGVPGGSTTAKYAYKK